MYFTADAAHPDAALIRRLFPPGLYGAIVSFEIANAHRVEVFRFMDALRLVVRATRELSPKHRERVGIRENLMRLSAGIESSRDIIADL